LAAARSSEAVVPDSFTHGSSAQRQRWFNNGSVKACDTFSTKNL
jgi:predicted metalloprotease